MATAPKQIRGETASSLKGYSARKGQTSQECPTPLPRQTDVVTCVSERPDSGRLALHGCACVEPGDLPHIILVSSGDEVMQGLSQALDPCPLEIRPVKSCLEVEHEIGRSTTPEVIFTNLRLPDGDWKLVLQMGQQVPAGAEVIVVSRFVDVHLYLDTLEAGAFDFVVPPFRTVELGYIIVNAIYSCHKQRAHRFSGNFQGTTVA